MFAENCASYWQKFSNEINVLKIGCVNENDDLGSTWGLDETANEYLGAVYDPEYLLLRWLLRTDDITPNNEILTNEKKKVEIKTWQHNKNKLLKTRWFENFVTSKKFSIPNPDFWVLNIRKMLQ